MEKCLEKCIFGLIFFGIVLYYYQNTERSGHMLQRKITERIEAFYRNHPQKALMIIGARQVGKSYIIEDYAKKHYQSVIKVDLIENPDYGSLFSKAKSAEEILLRLSALFGDRMIPGKTMIFFDEVQECRELITQIKYLVQDGTYDYILSGSLLGTVFKDIVSVPVGYMDIIEMYPLDFEEFASANGVGSKVIDALRNSFEKKQPVDSFLHERITKSLQDCFPISSSLLLKAVSQIRLTS